MVEFEFEGRIYVLDNRNQWTLNHEIVHQGLQRILNRAYEQTHPLNDAYIEGIMQRADEMLNTEDYMSATPLYERALTNENATIGYINYILPRLSSCYRKLNMPNRSIVLLENYRNDFRFLSPALLTSVGAAYMDLNNPEKAREMANWAYALSHGRASMELHNLYSRINAAER